MKQKKNLKALALPSNHKKANVNSLLGGNEKHINQIRGYCIDEGIPYGIITNGYQFIFLKAFNNDGKPWKNNSCLIFDGIEDIEKRFVEFYENLSKHSIVSNQGLKFDIPYSTEKFKTIVSTVTNNKAELVRNDLSASITTIIDRVFGEIFSEEREDDIDFIKACFVENKETKKNKNEIERLFGDYAPHRENIIPIINSSNLATEITTEITTEDISIQNKYPPKPIIIIGSKGSGKTTFINHLFKYRFEEEIFENHFLIYIDFRTFYKQNKSFLPEKIAHEILEKLYYKYEDLNLNSLKVLIRIYLQDIKRNDQGIWEFAKKNDETLYQQKLAEWLENAKNDPLKHLEFVSKYLIRERRKRLIVIVDNADQFPDEIQENLFVFAHSLTNSTLCGTVISLREGYYYKWQNSPPFDAYESNVYHISAPNYSEVLQKRIDFALKHSQKYISKARGTNAKGINIELSQESITNYLSGIKNSLLTGNNKPILEFLNLTTYPNIREGLRIFKSFLTSSHTKVGEYILRETVRVEKRYPERSVIPMHEFIKSVSLQNRHYYKSENSVIKNIFIPPLDSTDHFCNIYILKELSNIAKRSVEEGYILNENLLNKFNSLGYRGSSINSALLFLIRTGLLDTDEQLSDVYNVNKLPDVYNLCITGKGYYYLTNLIFKFHYYDLIVQDTPIYDTEQFVLIKNSFPLSDEKGTRDIELRKRSILLFMEYLKNREHLQASGIKGMYGEIMNECIKNVETEISNMTQYPR